MAATARQQNFKRVFVPVCDAADAALIPGLEVIPVKLSYRTGSLPARRDTSGNRAIDPPEDVQESIGSDFSEIKGQEHAKRALESGGRGRP
jgi:magnesium chelatase family protein